MPTHRRGYAMDDSEFSRLLKICRIHLSEDERLAIKKDTNDILEYFNSLSEVSTKEVHEAYHPISVPEKMRSDVPLDFPDVPLLLKNTKTYRFYVVGPDI